jgi:preprotein translocase subunit SecA
MDFNIGKMLTKVFGSRNERLLKRYHRIVDEVNAVEAKTQALTDLQLRQRTDEIRKQIAEGSLELADVLPEAMSIMRESMDRNIGIRNIFNPDENFDPDKLDDSMLELYDSVQRQMIASGESWETVAIPPELYAAVRKLIPECRPPVRPPPLGGP